MKKYLFAIIGLLMCSLSMSAKTSKESAFANQILSYLRTEGYAPKIDDDGDVQFKYQGSTYWITVDEYDDGYYVKALSLMGMEDANRRGVLEACVQTMASYKYVRCYPGSQNVIVECAGFFSNLYQFKLMFANYMEVLTLAESKIKKVYIEYD